MAERTFDPMQETHVRLAVAVFERRDSQEVKAVIALLRHHLDAAKDDMVDMIPGSSPPGSLLFVQGHAHALKQLLALIEEGPEEIHHASDGQAPEES